ncbi:MAG: hypothetical protein J6K75_03355, partial [Erysipelotrichaceae bacterium]|nr:hypothetical protein [Erysipelotrichaceae bacterium]
MYSDYSSLIEYSDSRSLSLSVQDIETNDKLFIFNVEEDMTWLTVETKKILELPEGANIAQLLENFDYIHDSDVVSIKGMAYITGIDATQDTYIEHAIQLINMQTKEVVEIPATTTNCDFEINLGDGFTYQRISYQADLDVSLISSGCYTLKIVVRNGNYEEKSAYLMDQINSFIPKIRDVNDYQIRFIKNSSSCYRYELYVERNKIDFDGLISKPTKRNSNFGLESSILDNGILSMVGIAWMYNVNFTSDTNVSHQLLFVDEKGNIIEKNAETHACEYNYNQLLNTIFDWSNICFSTNIDLSELEKGIYTIYMNVSSDGFRDIYEVNNMYKIQIKEVEYEGRVYSLSTTNVRDRLVLTIK